MVLQGKQGHLKEKEIVNAKFEKKICLLKQYTLMENKIAKP